MFTDRIMISLGFFQALNQNISELYPEKIVMGDFNTVLNIKLDRYNSENKQ